MPALKPISYKLLVKAFEEEGFNFDRQRGDHLIYTKPGVSRPLVIPMYEAVQSLLRTFSGRLNEPREVLRTASKYLT